MKRAFTLIELLVVIAIIAILAAILFPVFAQAKLAAKKTVDTSNMKQLGLGLSLYTTDYDGMMPLTSHDTGLPAWVESLRPYLGNTDEVKICPVDPKGKLRLENHGTSYILNEYVCPQAFPPEGSQPNLDSLSRPSATITTFVVSDQKGVAETEDHTHSSVWVKAPHRADWANVLADITPDRFRGSASLDPKRVMEGSANYLYADTHVKSLPAKQIKGWIDARINFAIPPSE